jgi:hypothetical protein
VSSLFSKEDFEDNDESEEEGMMEEGENIFFN